ncbi:hypothetical protein BCR44DRAFT_1495772 [Catenaria anguillulae PL171]|uniref:Store-operated calcium entry-associated regulatory factor n=1 Tax=Catenaria anguillulae PL171 TaxID=765915 RepID=A0A1Y2I0K3_9FUNG|nr:hypothetical protein BCR44DRAFT_1495772 [Catenaria anguillulae PL171]
MTRRHRMLSVALLASTLLLSGAATPANAWGSDDKVLLTDVQTLTLYKGKLTAGRRSPPVQQLMCVGGDACDYFEPPVMQCKNMGHDGREVQWRCESEMEDYYRLGTTTVTCEGYKNRNDKYILRGSCGVEYTLHLTDKGRDAIARRHHGGGQHYDQYQRYPNQHKRKHKQKYSKNESDDTLEVDQDLRDLDACLEHLAVQVVVIVIGKPFWPESPSISRDAQ